MANSKHLTQHEVLPAEQIGELLVVKPAGDPVGFSPVVFRSELAKLKKRAAEPDVRHVLIDFSEADYFGSAMIGSLLELRDVVIGPAVDAERDASDAGGLVEFTDATETTGGVLAVCGLSEDMLAGLRILNVDGLIETYSSRAQALRKLAHETVVQRVGRMKLPWKRLSAAAAVAAVVCVFVFTPVASIMFGGDATSDFRAVTSTYERWERQSRSLINKESQSERAKPYIRELVSRRKWLNKHTITPARSAVDVASGRLMLVMLQPESSERRDDFRKHLEIARQQVFEETGVELDVPAGLGVAPVRMVANNDSTERLSVGEI